jgi:recombination protein RecA
MGWKDESARKAAETALEQINKQFGSGTAMWGNASGSMNVKAIPSGSLVVDRALGVGGYPRGRIVEIAGPESSGKTTLALKAMANVQASGGGVAIVDAEHALDPAWAERLGVNFNEAVISQPDSAEAALSSIEMLVRSGAFELIVLDSVAALTPQAEIDGEIGDAHVALIARLMSQALRKLTTACNQSGTTLIFINQYRAVIGGFGHGPKEDTPGGKALKYFASVRLDVRRISTKKIGEESVGSEVKVTVKKNKVSPPFKTCVFTIFYAEGLSREGELLSLGLENKLVKKSGSWFSYGDAQIGQGEHKARAYLVEHPEVADEIEQKVRALWAPPVNVPFDDEPTAGDSL